MTEKIGLTDYEVQLLLIERDVAAYRQERIDELLNKIGQAKGLQDAEKQQPAAGPSSATVQEIAFTALKWTRQQGSRIGDYETAAKADNDPAKWSTAHDILTEAKATIKDRYRGQGYQYSYWLYDSSFGQEKIYRQKHKA